METNTHIEKLKEEYMSKTNELEKLQNKYAILKQKYDEEDKKLSDTNDKIDKLEEEIIDISNNMNKDEYKYIEKKQLKLLDIMYVIVAVIALTFGRLPIFAVGKIVSFLLNFIISSILYFVAGGTILSAVLDSRSVKLAYRKKYRKTENGIKFLESIECKVKEKEELKAESISLGSSLYEIHRNECDLKKEIKVKQQEIEEIKQKVFDLFFGEIIEEKIDYTQTMPYCDKKDLPFIKIKKLD